MKSDGSVYTFALGNFQESIKFSKFRVRRCDEVEVNFRLIDSKYEFENDIMEFN